MKLPHLQRGHPARPFSGRPSSCGKALFLGTLIRLWAAPQPGRVGRLGSSSLAFSLLNLFFPITDLNGIDLILSSGFCGGVFLLHLISNDPVGGWEVVGCQPWFSPEGACVLKFYD